MNRHDKLFSEKMTSELQKKILQAAENDLSKARNPSKSWFHRWGLNAGLLAASCALALFIYTNQGQQTINPDLAAAIDLMDTVDQVDDIEMLADLDLIENLDEIEAFEEPG